MPYRHIIATSSSSILAKGTTRSRAAPHPVLVVATLLLLVSQIARAAETKNVLVLYSNNRLVPGNVEVDHGLRALITGSTTQRIQIFSEFLDRPDFGGSAYEDTETTYLREKYAARPPDAIVAVSDDALDFLLRHRAQLFPQAVVVHTAVSKSHLRTLPTLPANVVGVPREDGFADTIAQALRWHPAARRLIVVTGASGHDQEWEAQLRREIPAVAGTVSVEYLAGLPTASLLKRLAALGAD